MSLFFLFLSFLSFFVIGWKQFKSIKAYVWSFSVMCLMCWKLLVQIIFLALIPVFSPSGIANEQKKLYGTQFHPEVDLTERGMEMLRTFLFEIAGCTSNFTVQNRQQVCIDEIREKVDKSKVLVSESGPMYQSLFLCVMLFKPESVLGFPTL